MSNIKTEKIVVFDSSGNPKELRYYEAEKLVARLGTILDGDNNFIGLRELDVEAVSPSSWLERAKGLFGKQAPKRIDVLTVDFIGLINWINTIKTIKTIEKIESIESVDKVKIESIESMPNITILGSEGAAFQQTAPTAGAYFSPTGVEPPFVGWVDTDDAFDANLATYAGANVPWGSWSNFLILTFPPTVCNKTRYYIYSNYATDLVDVDVYQDGSWVNVYQGTLTNNVWIENSFGQGLTSKWRIRFYCSAGWPLASNCRVHEVEMWKSATGSYIEVRGTLTQSTKHDAKTYLFTASGSAADGATVISNVADKVTKIHRLFLQSTVDGATDVYFYEETSGNKVTTNTTLNAREGRESAFVPAPACIGKTTTVNKKVLLKNAATKQVYWEVTYSVDDAA